MADMTQSWPCEPFDLIQWLLDFIFWGALWTPLLYVVACNSSNVTMQHAGSFAWHMDFCCCSRDSFGWGLGWAGVFKIFAAAGILNMVLLVLDMLGWQTFSVVPDRVEVHATIAAMRLKLMWSKLYIRYLELRNVYAQWRLRRLRRRLQERQSAVQARKQGLYKSPAAHFCEQVLALRVVRVGIAPMQHVVFQVSKVLCLVGLTVWLSVQWCSSLCSKLYVWYNHMQRSRRHRSSRISISSSSSTRKGGKRSSQHGTKSGAAASKGAAGSTKAALAAEAAVPSTSILTSCATGASTALGAVASCSNKATGELAVPA
jgi:hypothetical protein